MQQTERRVRDGDNSVINNHLALCRRGRSSPKKVISLLNLEKKEIYIVYCTPLHPSLLLHFPSFHFEPQL
ncbi:hypothetical protein G7K_3903-t1 [Saitoella complicata NRRL Y-17804]|uniref:Uncharacterized protein n=1 Tax=Saitoella complicata (strain BCRC 22490 / CBS 7301 / JCM 7358 / NBRC 10748 / NRRL Y-17804) TaxID=698492 RepID=A0A0E9NJ79_SAICN|nr:hypothetical protein G7K_3903-t1 [Saitoella complicata NRRL Y-17804]